MQFRLLGPVEVSDGDERIDLGGAKQRALLALLLLNANKTVRRTQVIDWLWDREPPRTAGHLVHECVSRARRALRLCRTTEGSSQRLLTHASGYTLQVEPDELDLDRFERLVEQAQQGMAAHDLQLATAILQQALGLWRGSALADLPTTVAVDAERARLEEARMVALEERLEIDLRLGQHTHLVGELETLVATHPNRERLRRQLMLALYRSGRQAEALTVYRDTRQMLVEELGLEPSLALQELERAILRADPALELAMPTAGAALHDPGWPIGPCQLPPDVDDFTGREAVVAQVERLLEGDRSTAIVISAIAGKAGVGKTALAVRVAHRLRPHFADGQLYVNLRGAEAQALDPADVLAGFLRALGVEGAAIAEGLEERVQQFRARLADRRVLVVLDNAADEAQVRPLLPASQGCAALVTSRTQLSGLEAAHPLCLDVLDPDQAVQLLAKLAGSGRVAAEPEAAAAIVRLCGWLPLAVRIAGARLASRPQWRLALLAERLADEHRRLDELTTGDLEVRASVALSYFGRGEVERRLFRLLGLLAAPSIPAWVAAALLETGPMEAEGLLERLVNAQLVEAAGQDQTGQLRYRLHDLLRVYARERLALEEPEPARRASLQRAVEAYLTLAERADALLVPSGLYRYSGDPVSRPAAEHPAAAIVERDPSGWFEVERASLVAAVEHGCETGKGNLGWRLADTLTGFFQLHTHWDDWQQTHTLALAAARRAGDRDAEGCVLGGLGELHTDRACLDDARRCLHQSLAAFRETGNRRRELQCLLNLGFIDHEQGRFDDAIARLEPCLVGFQELGSRSWEAMALFCLGKVHLDQGRLDAAMACLDQSLTLVRAVADRSWEAAILRRIGLVRSAQGWPEAAVACLEQSLMLVRATGERPGEAYVLQSLGEVYRKQGRLDAATRSIQDSLALARVTGDRSVEAFALHTLGDIHREQGRLDDAAACLEASLATFRDLELRHWEARVLNSLGLLLDAKSNPTAACRVWHSALAIFHELDMPEAADVAAQLAEPPTLAT
jgi:DNA-binding SARP family transcriptional activator/predicted negative regulator of RcsB-dependent stress response